MQHLAVLPIPDPRRPVPRRSYEALAVGAERDGNDAMLVAAQHLYLSAGCGVIDARDFIGHDKRLAVRLAGDFDDTVLVMVLERQRQPAIVRAERYAANAQVRPL